jgi:hypothetical protein
MSNQEEIRHLFEQYGKADSVDLIRIDTLVCPVVLAS